MRRRAVLSAIACAAAFALLCVPSASAQESLDASCPGPTTNGSELMDPTFEVAQTFTALATGKLTRAQVEVSEAPEGLRSYRLAIHRVTALGIPSTAEILATAEVPDPPSGVRTLTGIFAAPATVAAGEGYALVVSRPGEPQGFEIRMRTDNPCAGNLYVRNSGGPFTIPVPTWDVVFSTSVTPFQSTCKGRQATIEGTLGNDELVGTAGPDVITGLGGRDEISGLDGKDRLCGGPGKDVLRGGGSKDKLFGQGGKDKLRGGGGKDVCTGGKKNDSAKGCEREKSI